MAINLSDTLRCHASILGVAQDFRVQFYSSRTCVFRPVAKLWKASSCLPLRPSVRPSARPYGTTRLPLDRFSWNLIFKDFSKICRENSSFIKIGREKRVLYMGTHIHFCITSRSFLFRMRHVSGHSCRENKSTHFVFSNVFRKYCRLWYNVEKYLERGGPQMTVWCMCIACWIPKATNTQTRVV